MTRTVLTAASLALAAAAALAGGRNPASAAEQWNFYMHQSAPNFATSRGAKLFTEQVEKATGGELKIRLHLAGTLQINASNITQAVGENVVQIGDDLFNSGNVAIAGNVSIDEAAFLGINASVRGGVRIGREAVVGMGGVVLYDVADGKTVVGNPARPLDSGT